MRRLPYVLSISIFLSVVLSIGASIQTEMVFQSLGQPVDQKILFIMTFAWPITMISPGTVLALLLFWFADSRAIGRGSPF